MHIHIRAHIYIGTHKQTLTHTHIHTHTPPPPSPKHILASPLHLYHTTTTPALRGEALYCGLYLNELTLRLLMRNDPHPEVFEQYRETLGALATGEVLQSWLRLYEKQLLDATGFGLILDREAGSTSPVEPGARYDYQPERGPVRVAAQARNRPGLVSGQALLALDAGHVDPEDWSALRHMMRRVLRHHLGDKPLASEALYRALRRDRPDTAQRPDPPATEKHEHE